MLITGISYLLESVLGCCFVLFILNKFLCYDVNVKKIATGIIIPVLIVLLFVLIKIDVETADIFTLLFYVLVPYCLLDVKKKLPVFWLGISINFSFDLITRIITKITNIETVYIYQLIFSGLLLIALFAVLFVFYKQNYVIPKDFIETIPSAFYFVTLIALTVIYIMIDILGEQEGYENLVLISIGVFVVAAFACLAYIVFKFITVSLKQKESLVQLDLQTRHYEELAQKNQDIRRFRHDQKNHMFALNILLNEGKLEEAKKYVADMNFALDKTENRFNTGNLLADAILSNKADEAKKNNITVSFDGGIPSDNISNSDICTILANSLDNAIRACVPIAPCTIKVEANYNEKGFSVTVSNPVTQKIEIKNNSIKTSKKDTENHGLGIGNIKRIAEKHNGYVHLNCTDTEFSIKIGLLF